MTRTVGLLVPMLSSFLASPHIYLLLMPILSCSPCWGAYEKGAGEGPGGSRSEAPAAAEELGEMEEMEEGKRWRRRRAEEEERR